MTRGHRGKKRSATERKLLRKGHQLVTAIRSGFWEEASLEDVGARPDGKQVRSGGGRQKVEVPTCGLPWEIQGRDVGRGVGWDPERGREGRWVYLNARGCLSNACGWRKKPMESKRLEIWRGDKWGHRSWGLGAEGTRNR